MFADLILFTEPRRPLINPKLDLFAWLELGSYPPLFPARVVDHVQLMLPEKCKSMDYLPNDIWEFLLWQAEEHGIAVVRSIDKNWLYWSILADKWSLHKDVLNNKI